MTLKEVIYNSVINLHRRTGEEWIPLKTIYAEVAKFKEVKNGGASIRRSIEEHCAVCDAFEGDEKYISKEKGTGLYKSIYYDKVMAIEKLTIGDVFTREQFLSMFKISGQSGIMKTNTLNCLVLTTSESNGVYKDSSIQNGMITYTGEGLLGDQSITKNNKTLYESKKNDIPVYLFSKDRNKKYIFEGKVELYDEPYQMLEEDDNHKERIVWKFPLKILYPENYDFKNDDKINEIAYKIKEIENKIKVEDFSEGLVFKDGPINIRKYRKTGKHLKKSSKPDFIALEIVKSKQGIINEKRIYEEEIKRLMAEEAEDQVQQMEEFFKNKKENEGFDILTFERNEKGNYIKKYIEVKSTKGNESTPIDITADEYEFAKEHVDDYYLYRIINSDSPEIYVKVIKGSDLLKDYNFVPTAYKIYSL